MPVNSVERGAVLPGQVVRAVGMHPVLGVDKKTRTVTAVVSTGAVDSYGESVVPEAFERRLGGRFASHRPMFRDHDYSVIIGEWEGVEVRNVPDIGRALVATGRVFEGYEEADKAWAVMSQAKSLAFSVGFLVHDEETRTLKIDGRETSVKTYTDVELIEISFVGVPANPDAVLLVAAARTLMESGIIEVTVEDPEKSVLESIGGLAAVMAKLGEVAGMLAEMSDRQTHIEKQLSAAPGGRLHQLILDTVRTMQRHGSPPADPGVQPNPPAADESLDRLESAVRQFTG